MGKRINPIFRKHKDKYLCSVETDAGTYIHNYALDNYADARIYAPVLFKAKPSQGTIVRTVAIMRNGYLIDTYDGGWTSDDANRMFDEEYDDWQRWATQKPSVIASAEFAQWAVANYERLVKIAAIAKQSMPALQRYAEPWPTPRTPINTPRVWRTDEQVGHVLALVEELIGWADADAEQSIESEAWDQATDDRARAKRLRQAHALIVECRNR
jgi:hypothetical protein